MSPSKRCKMVPKPLAVALALDMVALPMPRHQTLCNLFRTLINAGHVGNLSALVGPARVDGRQGSCAHR